MPKALQRNEWMSVQAYQMARKVVETPRATEHRLLGQITGEMIVARDSGLSGAGLVPCLHRNREIWSVFSSLCAAPGNGLPAALRANIISIGLWVERFTTEVVSGRESMDPLIEVNRSIMEGLAGQV